MTTPTVSLRALFGIIYAYVFITAVTSEPTRPRYHYNENDENRAGDPAPDLNCILFGTSACDATCNTIGYLYNVVGHGTCNASQTCICKIEQESDLKSLWNERMENDSVSEWVLSEIEAVEGLSEFALETLLEFPRINDEILDEFKTYDIERIDQLKTKQDTSPIIQFIQGKYKLKETELRKHLADFIQQSLKDGNFTIADTNYQSKIRDNLSKYFRDHKVTSDIIEQIRQTNNRSLAKFVGGRNARPKYSFQFDKKYDYEYVPDFVAAAINDEFVKFVDEAAKTSPKPKPITEPSLRTVFLRISPIPKPSSSPNTADPATSAANMTYSTPDFKARIDKTANGTVTVYWRGDDTIVNHNSSVSGAIDQTWEFGDDVTIKFDLLPGGAIRQIWKIGNDNYQYERLDDGSVRESGHISPDTKNHYENRIELWCRANETFFESGNCVIYNKL